MSNNVTTEIQEWDEEYFGDELEAAKEEILAYIRYIYNRIWSHTGREFYTGNMAWQLLLVDSDKVEAFLEQCKTCKTGFFKVADYAKILWADWGESVPQHILDKAVEFFSKRVNDLFVIKEEHKNNNVYSYVIINPDKRDMFLEQYKTGLAMVKDIKNYGRILYSGWGRQDPTEIITDKIIREYFCTAEFDLCTKEAIDLHDAARDGELRNVRNLISKGALCFIYYVNLADKNGWTSLHHAAFGGDLEVAKFLIDSGADLYVKDTVCGREPVHIAAREGHTNVIELFLKRGVNVSEADEKRWTPLHYAAWNGHLRTIKLLINEGADINAKEVTRGKKSIHIAAERGYTDAVELFLKNDVSIDDTDEEGLAVLQYAASRGHLKVVKFLVGKGANIHTANIHGQTPIYTAAFCGHRNVVEFFLGQGIKVNDSLPNNWTLLHFAAEGGHVVTTKFLIKIGANIDARNNDSKTPLDIARENGRSEVVDILKNFRIRRADIDIRNNSGNTALHLAAEGSGGGKQFGALPRSSIWGPYRKLLGRVLLFAGHRT